MVSWTLVHSSCSSDLDIYFFLKSGETHSIKNLTNISANTYLSNRRSAPPNIPLRADHVCCSPPGPCDVRGVMRSAPATLAAHGSSPKGSPPCPPPLRITAQSQVPSGRQPPRQHDSRFAHDQGTHPLSEITHNRQKPLWFGDGASGQLRQ